MLLRGISRDLIVPRRNYRLMVLIVVAITAAVTKPARAQQMAETGRIVALNGRVSAERSGDLWALAPGQTIGSGQVVVTGPDGYAQLELSDHSIIEVFPNSRVIFRPNRTNWRDLIDIYLGKIRLQIQHLTNDDSPYHVASPTAVISIRGTVLDVEVDPIEDTTVRVETGSVNVRHRLLPGKEVVVQPGQILQVLPNVPLAASKLNSPLVVAERIGRFASETAARIGNVGIQSGGSHGGSSKPSGGNSGTNQPKPAPGQGGNGTDSPPGDVIKR